jgi:hypothetical protein
VGVAARFDQVRVSRFNPTARGAYAAQARPLHVMAPPDRTAYLAPEWRLQDLRRSKIVNLPTPRRRRSALGAAAFCAFCVYAGVMATITGGPVYALTVLLFLLGVWAQLAEAREITRQLRTPRSATSLGEVDADGAEAVAGGALAVALSGGAGLYDIGGGIATKVANSIRRRRGQRRLARRLLASPPPAGEQHIVSCRATQRLHGPWRLLLPLTFWIAGTVLWRAGWLTLTDRHLRYRSLTVPLEEVEILEWFKGSFSEAHEQVLVIRAGGRTLRLCIEQIWAEEAQWVFDVLASRSARPPAFLAARWSLHP